ncbi:MAG: zinc ribbon domain-containing protein [Thermodesulfobacteriota bacterium]
MPIYEYKCKACNKKFEEIVLGGEEPDACRFCGSKKIGKLMSAGCFHTKDKSGLTTKSSASASSCSGCSSSSCAGCH